MINNLFFGGAEGVGRGTSSPKHSGSMSRLLLGAAASQKSEANGGNPAKRDRHAKNK